MNHKFKSNASSPAQCIECSFDVVAHSEFATCDCCRKFPCTVSEYMDMVMCDGCIASESEAALLNKGNKVVPEPIQRLESEFQSTVALNFKNGNETGDDLPMNGTEFFNAEVESHIEMEKRILANPEIPKDKKKFDFVQQMQMRQAHLQVALKKGIELLNETRDRLSATQRDINLMSAKLRKDEREKLKIADINYVPVKPPTKVVARTTEKNKVVINIAQIFCAPRDAKGNFIWNELTDEQREECLVKARQIFSSNMSLVNSTERIIEANKKDVN